MGGAKVGRKEDGEKFIPSYTIISLLGSYSSPYRSHSYQSFTFLVNEGMFLSSNFLLKNLLRIYVPVATKFTFLIETERHAVLKFIFPMRSVYLEI